MLIFKIISSILLFLAVPCSAVLNAAERIDQEKSLPNILFLVADDAGAADYGCYGHPTLKTPNIDKLAAEGVRFTQAILTSSSCSPSRTSILSGQYAHSIGTEDMHVPMPDSIKILPHFLQQKGYFTGSMFKTHFGPHAEKQFQWYSNNPNGFPEFLNKSKNTPFFMWMGFDDPHRPYNENEYNAPFNPADVTVPPYLADTPKSRKDLANYYSEISRLDEQIGRVMAELERRGLIKNTLIVFLSDNGSPFPGAKGTLYDTGVQTPLIMSWPGKIRAGQEYNGLVSSIDLAPTILDIASVPVPTEMKGQSMSPLFSGKGSYTRKYAFSERNWHGIDEHIRSVRTTEFKLITNEYTGFPHGTPSDLADSPSWKDLFALKQDEKLTASQARIFRYPRPAKELYDIRTDPFEMNNLAARPEYESVLKEMTDALHQWEVSTRDVSVDAHLKKDKTDRFTGKEIKN